MEIVERTVGFNGLAGFVDRLRVLCGWRSCDCVGSRPALERPLVPISIGDLIRCHIWLDEDKKHEP